MRTALALLAVVALAGEARADEDLVVAPKPYRLELAAAPAPAPAPAPVARDGDCCCAFPQDDCGWRFRVSIPVWVPLLRGSLASGDVKVQSRTSTYSDSDPISWLGDVDLADTVASLDFFYIGGIEARHGRWTIGFETEHADLDSTLDWNSSDASVDGSFAATIARGWIRYEVGRTGGACGPCVSWGPYVGGRYYSIDVDVESDTVDIHRKKSWFDPSVGLDAELLFRNGIRVHGAADVGGFFEDDTDLSWSATAEVVIPLSCRWEISLGWSWHDIVHKTGHGDDRFELDVMLAGPRLALSFWF
jgi:hypothetical protein